MKGIFLIILAAVILIGASILFGSRIGENVSGGDVGDRVAMVDGKQIISIDAKGGYFPRSITARADVPTVLEMKTKGTFDCSSAVVIPSLNYRANLPPSGVTRIDVPPQKTGTTLNGTCSMGMYGFTIAFQ